MDTERLIKVLDAAIKVGIAHRPPPSVMQSNPISLALWNECHVWTPPDVLESVATALREERDLSELEGGWIRRGWGGTSTGIREVAEWLLAQALKRGARLAVTAFEGFMRENSAPLLTVCAVYGLPVRAPTQLTERVKIVPANCLPPSYGLAGLWELLSPSMGVMLMPEEVAALVIEDPSFSPVLTKNEPGAQQPVPREAEEAKQRSEMFATILRCLALVGPRSTGSLLTWSEVSGDGVPKTASGGLSYGAQTLNGRPTALGAFDVKDAQQIMEAFLALPLRMREALEIPLDRLNQAMREPRLTDKAIDLGIALEALLLHDLREKGELSHRLSLRGVWLRGGDAAQRRDTYDVLRRIYYLRSHAVHAGRLDGAEKKAGGRSMEETLDVGLRLCGELIRKIIAIKEWPDWTGLVLGSL